MHGFIPLWAARDYLWFFGAIAIIGGLIGFLKANSVASLIAGGVSGALLILAGLLMGAHLGAAALLTLVVSVALLGRFAPALAKGKRMPAVYMAPLAAAGLAVGISLALARWG